MSPGILLVATSALGQQIDEATSLIYSAGRHRRHLTFASGSRDLSAAVFRVQVIDEPPGKRAGTVGTATAVGKDLLLVPHHCIHEESGEMLAFAQGSRLSVIAEDEDLDLDVVKSEGRPFAVNFQYHAETCRSSVLAHAEQVCNTFCSRLLFLLCVMSHVSAYGLMLERSVPGSLQLQDTSAPILCSFQHALLKFASCVSNHGNLTSVSCSCNL